MKFQRTLLFDGREVYVCKLRSGAELCVAKTGFMRWDWSIDFDDAHIKPIVDSVPHSGRSWFKFIAEEKAVAAWRKAVAIK